MRFGTHSGAVTLVGKPLSGKGTQSKSLAAYISAWRFTTGDICRKRAEEDTEIGREVRRALKEGNIVRDEIILEEIVREKKFNTEERIVLDGVPRSVPQAHFILRHLSNRNVPLFVIYIKIS